MTGLRLVIPRPLPEAETLAARLTAAGHRPLVSPLLTIQPLETALPDIAAFQALLVTSPSGARALAAATPDRTNKLLAVGAVTAQHLKDAGFSDVVSADGDGRALAALIGRTLKPEAGPLLHVGGADRAVDFQALLPDFKVETAALYEAVAADGLPEELERALRRDELDGILLTSPRIAAIFARLVRDRKLTKSTVRLSAYCLSPAVSDAAALPFGKKRVAAKPDIESLLSLLGETTVAEPTAAVPSPTPAPKPEAAKPTPPKPEVVKPAQAPEGQKSSGGFVPGFIGGVLGAGLVAALLAGTVSTWQPYILPTPATPPTSAAVATPTPSTDPALLDRLRKIEQDFAARPSLARPADAGSDDARIAALEQELAALKARPAEAPAPAVNLDPLRDRLDALDQRMRGAADAGAVTALLARLEEVNRKAEAAEAAAGGQVRDLAQRGNLALATAQIAVAARDGRSFAEPVQALKRLVGTDADFNEPLATLTPIAGNLPTLAALRDEFPAVARAAKTAELVAHDIGWWAEVERLAGRLITIRRTDKPPSDSLDDKLTRTEALLGAGALTEIPALLTGLEPTVEAAVAPWRDKLSARIAADGAVARLTELALTRSGKE
ncbi:uroporphyrinogen-III synthase [Lacibacterium aquatile]|uniref:Uroporphyrinogen-III synthase n=1 Tax=Lacibacterium aquatile TaxID=1168082 RepID=A0ABW5DQW7_9PROT